MKEYLERASYDWSADSIRFINTVSENVKKTFFYVQEAGYFKTKAPYFTERENLDSFLIIYTISGNGILKIDQKEYKIESQKILFIPCMKHHYYACEKESEWEFLWLHFNGIAARGYYEEFNRNMNPLIELNDSTQIQDLMWQILSNLKEKEFHHDIYISNLITNLLTIILIHHMENENEKISRPAYVDETIKYLELHFKEDLTLDELSKKIGLSKYYLLKQFKKYTGTTITEHLIMSRLNYAKEMLKYTEEPISEITYACGMNHVSHFIRLFQKHEHITPLQYRKQWS